MISSRFDRLVALLKELFQLDKPELDFGFYRIMHAREREVTHFLERDLLPRVKEAFARYESADRAAIEKKLEKAEAQAEGLGMDPPSVPRVRDLRERMDAATVDVASLEADVYDHLYRFFRRYYSEGDFVSQRVYKDGVYAIPYQGEEVKLHWANADQYYIKTTEYLRDYSFRLRPDDPDDPMRVHFRLVDAAEGEHDNVKERDEKARRFVLAEEDFVAEERGTDGAPELVIRFVYRPARESDLVEGRQMPKRGAPKQKVLTEAAVKRVLALPDPGLRPWIAALGVSHVKADGSRADYSRLRAHLDRYTARNTFDYFIHKDLGGFLRQELDFYVKNEVMRLDDIEDADAPRVEEWLSKIKVVRSIAHTIIDFLAQLENFQKKLWLKKKFVVETSYCITVGTIPEEFHAEIAANQAQHDEWVELFAIDEIGGDLVAGPGYSGPLAPAFLAAHPTLVVDTRHFDDDFTGRLLATLGDIDEKTDGVLFHSENFQALRLMQRRYGGRVDCMYIDPPYNAQSSEILYKNSYKHSSWLSLMTNSLRIARALMHGQSGTFVAAIDEVEQERFGQLLSVQFPSFAKSCIAVNHNPPGRQGDNFSFTHEYVYFLYRLPGRSIAEQVRDDAADWDERNFRDVTGAESLRVSARNCFYPILVRDGVIVGFGDVCPDDFHPSINEKTDNDTIAVYPVDPQGVERKWRFARGTVESIQQELRAHRIRQRGVIDVKRIKKKFNYKSNWTDAKYSANNHGTQLLNHLIPQAPTSYPKSLYTVRDCVHAGLKDNRFGTVLDYFAGSGTTAHAVIALNRESDGGKRRFILVEMADYFDTVLVPRVKKVTFTPEWEGGKPKRLATDREAEASPRIVKIVRLESYEDTLNNLDIRRAPHAQGVLDPASTQAHEEFREEYLIRYMLDVEARSSASLLDIDAFRDPFAYSLKVKRPGSDESREVAVDLVETFNWLLGLRVSRLRAPERYSATLSRDKEGRLHVDGRLEEAADGEWRFRTIEGRLPDDRRVVVVWRNRPGGDKPEGIERDNAVLHEWFTVSGYGDGGFRFDRIYVNGDHHLESLRPHDQTGTAHMIEDHFKRLMFEDDEGTGQW